jgi:hypothetical protein
MMTRSSTCSLDSLDYQAITQVSVLVPIQHSSEQQSFNDLANEECVLSPNHTQLTRHNNVEALLDSNLEGILDALRNSENNVLSGIRTTNSTHINITPTPHHSTHTGSKQNKNTNSNNTMIRQNRAPVKKKREDLESCIVVLSKLIGFY